jgi:hypothetical protein
MMHCFWAIHHGGEAALSLSACGEEELGDVHNCAAASFWEVAVEGSKVRLEMREVRIRSTAHRVKPSQIGPLSSAQLARIEAVMLSRHGVPLCAKYNVSIRIALQFNLE